MERKTKRIWIRLSADEEALFRRKAARYKTISAMVRDAVKQFDDTATRGMIFRCKGMKPPSDGLGIHCQQAEIFLLALG